MSTRRRLGGEAGVGGVELLPVGVLVFIVGTLVVVNAWGVVDASFAASAAAREAARAYVEAGDGEAGLAAAERAAGAAIAGHGHQLERMAVRPVGGAAFHRCATVTFEVTYEVPAVVVPWVGGFSRGITARGRHSELVDPYRDGVPLAAGAEEVRCG